MDFISALRTTSPLMCVLRNTCYEIRTFETKTLLLIVRSTPCRYTCNDKQLAAGDAATGGHGARANTCSK